MMGGVPPAHRARAREIDLYVAEIHGLLVAGSWRAGETSHELAERWGASVDQVEHWAAQAGRMLRIGPDVDLYRGRNLARLDALAGSADGKVAIAAIAEQNKMLGLHAPQKVDVTVQTYAQLEPPAMLRKVREQIAKLQELERQLEANVITVAALPPGDDDDERGE